ncbi:MAG TPA: ABC transporter substrate-binding protein, partial [Bacteroidia bacterium]|nr:ABC transporter substrate-binding protein [Bacteroidia bacterium]
MKRIQITLFVLTVILAGVASCGPGNDEHDNRQVFRFNELGDVTSLDPVMSGSFENNWAANQIYNGLLEMDDKLNVQDCIATQWNISDDGLTYSFTLRQDVFFHDDPQFPGGKGRKVTASDFVYSFTRLFDKKISNASTLVDVIDYDESGNHPGFEATSDSTLIIHLRRPFNPFLGILTMKYFSVVPKEVVRFYGEEFKSHPVGTGPFRLKTWQEDNRLDLERNPVYFKKDENGKQLPYLDIVSVSFIDDPDAAFLQFLSGDLDMLSGIDAINKEKTMQSDGQLKPDMAKNYVLQSAEFLKTDYLGINIDPKSNLMQSNPLQLKLVRQAINYAIDREQIVRFRRNNLGTAATSGFIPPSMHAYDPSKLKGYSYDPDKARELLDMAHFPGGKGLPTITITTTSTYLDIAEEISHQLNEIGIPAKIDIMIPNTFTEAVAEGKVMCFRKSWIGDYPDPENFMSLFYSKYW